MNGEEKMYYWLRDIREPLIRPIVKVLAFFRVHPSALSFAGVFLMLGFIYFVGTNPLMSFYFLLAALAMDAFDGGLARYLKVDSDKGKFTDVLVDNLNFTLFIIGLTAVSLVSGAAGAAYVYFMLLARVLMVVRKNLGRVSDWLIRPMAGAFPNVLAYLSYAIFTVYVFTGADYLNITSMLFAAFLATKALIDFLLLGRLHTQSS
ncbi:MAG: CDP-alcohol phosphatidyltransferase family protein [Candidatus Colwellbacteria bacterium]|nr:CDP-alcohol phosphatidyltransferase family protein [Candidatus Colwellbacteria bacterium]